MPQHKKGKKAGNAERKPTLTHFLCLPLVTEASRPQLETTLGDFRQRHCSTSGGVLSSDANVNYEQPRLHPKAFIPVGALHCTLGVMSLDDQQLLDAKALLQSLDIASILRNASRAQDKAELQRQDPASDDGTKQAAEGNQEWSMDLATKPIRVDIQGLHTFQRSSAASNLYGEPIDHTRRLHPLCLAVRNKFQDSGLLKVEQEKPLQLHMTVFNTVYVQTRGRRRPPGKDTATPPTASKAAISIDVSDEDALNDDASGEKTTMQHVDEPCPRKIDATMLMQRYSSHIWGSDIKLDRLAICEMGAKTITNANGEAIDKRYLEVASIALPQ